MSMTIGDTLPTLKIPAVNNSRVCELNLGDYRGSYLVLFFYTMDDTEFDALEARGFMSRINDFEALGVKIAGVSRDGIESHLRFSKKFNLLYPLISDPNEVLFNQVGALLKINLLFWETHFPLRNTYIFDYNGNLIQSFERVSSHAHADDVYRYLEQRIRPDVIPETPFKN